MQLWSGTKNSQKRVKRAIDKCLEVFLGKQVRFLAGVSANNLIFYLEIDKIKMQKNRLGSIMAKIHKQIISLLETSEKPLSLVDIVEQIGKSEKTVFKALRKLFSDGEINCDGKSRLYSLAKEQS